MLKKLGTLVGGSIISLSLLAVFATASNATSVKITITNNSAAGGLSLTPLYAAFHDSSFDPFDVGDKASEGLEQLAELGSPAAIAAIRQQIQPESTGGVIAADAGGSPPPIQPGETASRVFDLNAVDHAFFTFLSMVLPSNDTFIGNDNALRIFNDMGEFLGPQTINVTGLDIYDAGTEVNDPSPLGGAAPFNDAPGGVDEDGVITQGQSLAGFAGQNLFGTILSEQLIDFTSNPGTFNLATIQISAVPLPAALPLFGAALLGIGFLGKRRKKNAISA